MAYMHPLHSLVVVLAFARMLLAAIGPVADLVISNRDVNPDGFTRSAVVAGGSTIGPLISANKGDNFKINVINKLNDDTMVQSTSIHWHGINQRRNAWADGPAFVTQCPIVKGNSFLYDFPTGDQAGTFWYHSHLSTQYCDGLRGPLVIYDSNDPFYSEYDVDDESTVITLTDWYHAKAKSTTIGVPDSTLINGLGRWSKGSATSPLSVIKVVAGKRYRMRLINMSCDAGYTFSIDQHTMTVFEADGVNHQAVTVDSLKVFAGQRYSFIVWKLKAILFSISDLRPQLNANQTVGNYWIRADPNSGQSGFMNGINSAILRYDGATEEEPTTSDVTNPKLLNEAELHPLDESGAPGSPVPGGVDHAINLAFTFNVTDFHFYHDGVTYIPPPVPVLLQVLSGAQTADSLLPKGSVFPLPANSVIELSMPGGLLGVEHPMHLHGTTFDVVRVAGSDTYNYANPVRRDVVSIGGSSDNVTIRFRTDNVGPWILHCHIDFHMDL
ncbi:laccase, multicopper oxidase, benzenediol:oxygen oxidorectuctase [Paramarasmius palmivorus]|uniref:Laccase, multicopper oxidase, benzenediol:oxygen oxidorectuctase n=1 Tax=Paramarasmius palmivorus TaxID=297713 RepID=A0AAW0BRT6_9AGAR